MNIAILSGKGGTGKTLVTVNLAAVANNSVYIDCDVEEPNGHLYFKPKIIKNDDVLVKIPFINDKLCDGCRKCVDFCQFNALAFVNNKVIVFDEICHSCGGCAIICPQKAIKECDHIIGNIVEGIAKDTKFYSGKLNPGEASGVPIIKKLIEMGSADSNVCFIDCPPGSSCIVMESIKDADYCVLISEPTLFGAHNLNMVYELVGLFKKRFGVVINKGTKDEDPTEKFCLENGIQILMKIPFDNELGKLNSNGEIAVYKKTRYWDLFASLLEDIYLEIRK